MIDALVDAIGRQTMIYAARVVDHSRLATHNTVIAYSQALGNVHVVVGWHTWIVADDVILIAQPNNAEKYSPYVCVGFLGRSGDGAFREVLVAYDHRTVPTMSDLPRNPRLGHLINVGGTMTNAGSGGPGSIVGGVWHIYTRNGWVPFATPAAATSSIAYMGQAIFDPPIPLDGSIANPASFPLPLPVERSAFTGLFIGSIGQAQNAWTYTPTIQGVFTFDATVHLRGKSSLSTAGQTGTYTLEMTLPTNSPETYAAHRTMTLFPNELTSAFFTITVEVNPAAALSMRFITSFDHAQIARVNYTFSYSIPEEQETQTIVNALGPIGDEVDTGT